MKPLVLDATTGFPAELPASTPLDLQADPASALQAATKQYVDTSRIIAASGTSVTVQNTTTLTNLVNQSVAGGRIGDGSNGPIFLRGHGYFRSNSATNSTLRFVVTFGSTTVFDATTSALTSNAGIHSFDFEIRIQGAGATNAQSFVFKPFISSITSNTAGSGSITAVPNGANGINGALSGTASEDTTSAKTLTFAIAHGQADTTTLVTVLGWTLSS